MDQWCGEIDIKDGVEENQVNGYSKYNQLPCLHVGEQPTEFIK